MTRFAGTMRLLSHSSRHAAEAFISGHLILLLLLFGAIFLGLLAAPVLGDALFGSVREPMSRSGPTVFVIGLGVLILGVVAGTPVLDIIGVVLMVAVLIGVLMVHY